MTQTNSYRRLSLRNIAMLCLSALPIIAYSAEERDSVKTKVRLQEVRIEGHHLQTTRAAMPVQLFSENEFSRLNATNVTDVAKHFAGVTVKDYGGIGGLKTVSLRGLGAQHTGVSYDGVMLSDIQSGQIDLSRFSLDNISDISLNNGQPNDIFQTARMFASAGVLCLNTKLPEYNGKNEWKGNASVKAGSFGMFNPSLFLNRTLGKKWAMNLSADGIVADGKYKYIQPQGAGSNVTSIEKTRLNGDITSIKLETNFIYRIRSKESISLKVNNYQSKRGLPGAYTLFNDYSNQRLWDNVFLTQLHYENRTSDKFQYQLSARFNRAYNRFREIDGSHRDTLSNPEGIQTDHYLQREYYATAYILYRPAKNWAISAATDWWYNNLRIRSNIFFDQFNYPTRHTSLTNLATKYISDRWNIGANVLYTLTREHVSFGIASPDRSQLSPAMSISYKLLDEKELRIRAFYKNIFRLPTFNDLYYQEMGNPNLKPEKTQQYNLGLIYRETEIPRISELEVSVDGYFNDVKNKIIATPRDLFHWSMINKGIVKIYGLDCTLKAIIPINKTSDFLVRGNYTYQNAKDQTPGNVTYGEQIPYTPFHSGSASASFIHKQFEAGYNLIFSGKRWNGQVSRENRLTPYFENSAFASKDWRCRKNTIKVKGEITNLFDEQYEVVKFYPMPGRNYRITLSTSF